MTLPHIFRDHFNFCKWQTLLLILQLELLLRAIYRPQNQYCIHIDAKQPDSFTKAIKDLAGCFDNVFIASKLEYVVYAGFSRLQVSCRLFMFDYLNSVVIIWGNDTATGTSFAAYLCSPGMS